MLKGVIIDDELRSRESLRILIEDFCDNVEVMAVCQNCDEGEKAIRLHNPDVIFLDIQMQRESGFDLLSRFDDVNFEVIFTTAYSEYAIKAFKYSALDYLLKPISIEDVTRALAKVEKKLNGRVGRRPEHIGGNRPVPTSSKLALPTNEGLVFVSIDEILYCEASSNYTIFHMVNGKEHIVSRTLKEYDDMLAERNFFRIHHSHIINLNSVKKYVRGEGGYVVMNNEKALDVSKRRKQAFLERLGQ